MQISVSFTTEELDELLTLAGIGEYVRDGVLDDRGEYGEGNQSNLLEKLHAIALEQKIPGIETVDLDGMMYTGPNEERESATHEWVEEHDEENFWSTLSARLGRRDFFKEMTKEDEAEMDKTGWLPERVQGYLDAYETEFESYGVERMMIDQNAPIPAAILEEEN